MRLYKVVLLVILALAMGFFFSWLWWGPEMERLTRELTAVNRLFIARHVGKPSRSARGIVQRVAPRATSSILPMMTSLALRRL